MLWHKISTGKIITSIVITIILFFLTRYNLDENLGEYSYFSFFFIFPPIIGGLGIMMLKIASYRKNSLNSIAYLTIMFCNLSFISGYFILNEEYQIFLTLITIPIVIGLSMIGYIAYKLKKPNEC